MTIPCSSVRHSVAKTTRLEPACGVVPEVRRGAKKAFRLSPRSVEALRFLRSHYNDPNDTATIERVLMDAYGRTHGLPMRPGET